MYGLLTSHVQHTCQAEAHEDAGVGVLRDAGLVVQDPGARDGRGTLRNAQPCSTAQRVAGSACAAAMTWDMPAGRWAVWANGLWGTLALSDNLEMLKFLGKCNPQVWLAEDYMNATGRLVSSRAPVATPLWNSGQAVTSADAPPPGACCASAHHCQIQPYECSATLKTAQKLMLILSLKDSTT